MKTLLLIVTVLERVDKAGEAASRNIEKAGENIRDAAKGKK